MADENTLRIEIDEVTDPRSNPLLDEFMSGGASPPPLPAGAAAKGGPEFPGTVLGPDGKAYSFDAFQAAQKKFRAQQQNAEAKSAYDSFFGPPPLPKKPEPPDTVMGADGKRYKSTEDYFKSREEASKGGGDSIGDLLKQFGLGGIGKGLGGGEALSGAARAAALAAPALLALEVGTKALHALTAAVDGVTRGLEGLAQNDLSGVDEGMNDFRRQLVGTVPIIGDAANAAGDFARAITSLPGKLDAAFIQRAHQLGGYNADIAYAEAKSEAKTTLADLREADTLGPDMARLVDAETELKLELRELILPIKKFVVEVLASRLELLVTLVRAVENFPTIWEKLTDTLGQVIVFSLNGDADERERALKILRDEIKNLLEKPKDDAGDLYDRFFDGLGQFPGEGRR